jgi:hypothetical protein
MDDSTSSENPILNLLNEDNYTISYRPAFAQLAGSVTAGILLQQMFYRWTRHGREPFYKFKEPCQHEDYQPGDAWCEELAFTRREFDGAIGAIGTKVTKGQKKADLMAYQWPPLPADQTSAEYKRVWQEAVRHIVIYWTDSNRKTWYWVNEALLEKVIEATYSGKGAFRLYLENGGKRLYLGNGGKRLYPEPAESADTCLSETPSETPAQTPPENGSPTTTGSGDSARASAAGAAENPDSWAVVKPLIDRDLQITDPAILDELRAKGATYTLALVWEVTRRPNVQNPAGLAIHKLHNGGPAEVTLDVARMGLEQGLLDFEEADRCARRREQVQLLEEANAKAGRCGEPGEATGWDPPRPPETTGTPLLDATLDEKPPGKTLSWRDTWTAVLGGLQARLNPSTYASWVEGAKAVSYGDGVLTVRARHIMAQDWLSKREKEIGESLTRLAGMPVRVVFIAAGDALPSLSEPELGDGEPTRVAVPEAPDPTPPAIQAQAPGEETPVEMPAAAPPGWESPQVFWSAVLEHLQSRVSATAYGWFADSRVERYTNGLLTVRMSAAGLNGMRAPMFQREFEEITFMLAGRRLMVHSLLDEVQHAATV